MAEKNDAPDRSRKASSGLARASMWVAGSALFGSVALVLWNRGALKSMREARTMPEKPFPSRDDDIY